MKYGEVAEGLAKGAVKVLRKQKPKKTVPGGVRRGVKHWSGTDLTWAPEKPVKLEAVERLSKSAVARVDRLQKKAAKEGKPVSPARAATQHRKAMVDDRMKPVRSILRKRGYSWPKFKHQRLDKDPNLSKLSQRKKKERLAELYEQLGEDGFIKRFNL